MFNRLASYLLGGAAAPESADGDEAAAAAVPQDAAAEGITAVPVEARLRQVEVEGDDWILIDRNVEGAGAAGPGMDESWYVTPPACFTQPGPVHVETSPLEDLLIEHPSMSVYRAAGPRTHKDKKEKQRLPKRRAPIPEAGPKPEAGSRLPLAPRNNLPTCSEVVSRKVNNGSSRSSHHHHHHHHSHHHHQHNSNISQAPVAGVVAEQQPAGPRRSSVRDLRNARGDENLRIVQIRSAQKVLEKRSSQSAKRNRLERGNKVREVASAARRPSKRQDRVRTNNSGANNNRCRY